MPARLLPACPAVRSCLGRVGSARAAHRIWFCANFRYTALLAPVCLSLSCQFFGPAGVLGGTVCSAKPRAPFPSTFLKAPPDASLLRRFRRLWHLGWTFRLFLLFSSPSLTAGGRTSAYSRRLRGTTDATTYLWRAAARFAPHGWLPPRGKDFSILVVYGGYRDQGR